MLDDVQAGLFHGVDPGSSGLDFGEPQLFQFLEGLADRASTDFEALGEVAFRGQAIPRPVSAAEDVAAKFGRNLFAVGCGFQGGMRGGVADLFGGASGLPDHFCLTTFA